MGAVSDDTAAAVRDALTVTCARCSGRGKESWQVSSNPAEGREDWPCNRCNGVGTVTDREAVARVLCALGDVRQREQRLLAAVVAWRATAATFHSAEWHELREATDAYHRSERLGSPS